MSQRPLVTALALVSTPLAGLAVMSEPAAAIAPAGGSVFINEIHYDNAGTDTGEAIEVAAPAGTDLTGWGLVLYNGSGGTSYRTTPLAGTVADQQGGHGTASFTYPTNGIQNGSPDGIALVAPSGEVAQFLSYEGTMTAVGGPADGLSSSDIGVSQGGSDPAGESLQLTGAGTTYGDFAWTGSSPSSFGTVNPGQTFGGGSGGTDPNPDPSPGPCDVEVTHEIGEVQGTGAQSPLAGRDVTVEGVAVGDFQAPGQLGGVFLQDADGDGDSATSDGLFVHDPGAPELSEGDVVRVTGTVTEHFGLTQISDVTSIGACDDAALPTPTVLALPADDPARERLESMLVILAEPVTATETYTLGRYGELVVSAEGRLYQPSNGGTQEDALEQQLNDRRRLVIDDGSSRQNPDDVPFSDVDGGVIRLGDTVIDIEGVLTYAFDAWRLQPTSVPTVTRTNPRPAAPDEVGGDVQVASFNVLNFFTTIDRPGVVTDTGDDPRGADSSEELRRQRDKVVAALLALDADVVGLVEIENDRDDEALDALVSALNAASARDYAAVGEPDTGGGLFGADAIQVAMIYRPDAVRPMGTATTTTDDAFDNARLPLAQRFKPVGGGQPFTVVVNHFKSKGCGDAAGANADQGDGQGCWNSDRVEQADALLRMLGALDGEDFMIIGDLNAYGQEDPIDRLQAAGYVDTIDAGMPETDQYSYVFQGQAGYLDHALVSPHLARRIAGVDVWHINADEALFLDYNLEFNPDGFYETDPYRSSDHDPVLVGLDARPSRRD